MPTSIPVVPGAKVIKALKSAVRRSPAAVRRPRVIEMTNNWACPALTARLMCRSGYLAEGFVVIAFKLGGASVAE